MSNGNSSKQICIFPISSQHMAGAIRKGLPTNTDATAGAIARYYYKQRYLQTHILLSYLSIQKNNGTKRFYHYVVIFSYLNGTTTTA